MESKVAVIIPAYNEARNILQMLRGSKEWAAEDARRRHILVVDDGSTDPTREVLKSSWVEVIASSPKGQNVGKGGAFITGLRHVHAKYAPTIIVTLDADLRPEFPAKQVNLLTKELQSLNVDMVIGRSLEASEGSFHEIDHISGQRAIRMGSLMPLISGNRTWEQAMHRYGMEECLNTKINQRHLSSAFFYAEPAYRNVGSSEQADQIQKASNLLNLRRHVGRATRSALRAKAIGDIKEMREQVSLVYGALEEMQLMELITAKWREKFEKKFVTRLKRTQEGEAHNQV